MSKVTIKRTGEGPYTNKVVAYNGPANVVVVDREGMQLVPDHPLVRTLIANGSFEEVKAKAAEEAAEEATEEAEAAPKPRTRRAVSKKA